MSITRYGVEATPWLSYLEKPITLHSGKPSHWFIDAGELFRDAHLRESVLACWERALNTYSPPKPWYFVSVPEGGNIWANAIATRMKATWGVPKAKRDDVTPVMVEDVLTTGASVREVQKKYSDLISTAMILVVARRAPYPVTATWVDLFHLD